MSEVMDGYIRVSARRGRSGPGYITKDIQRERIERWAAYKGVTLGEWFIDEDWSGGTQERPGLEAAVERALNGETQGIVSWKIDRFSRFTEGGLRDLRRLQAKGSRLAFVNEDIDTSGPMGRFVYVIMLAMAELFLENIRAQWVDAKTRAVERGAYISRTPFGYSRQPDGSIAPHATEAPIVHEAYRRAGDEGLHGARDYLQEKEPGRRWTLPVTRKFLARRTYLGETHHGTFNGDTHEAIVTLVEWAAAQGAANHRMHERARPRGNYPLTGVLYCTTCNGAMVGGLGGKDHRRVYRCNGRSTHKLAKCRRGAAISAELLEEFVEQQLRSNLAPMRITVSDPSDRLRELEHTLAEAEEELQAAEQNTRVRKMLGERYADYMEIRIVEVAQAHEALREFAQVHRIAQAFQASDLLDRADATMFAVGVRHLLDSILVSPVSPGRRAVEQRVRLVPFDADDAAGVAAPERS